MFKKIGFIILSCALPCFVFANITINGNPTKANTLVYIKIGESVVLNEIDNTRITKWYRLIPIQKDYELSKGKSGNFQPINITYTIQPICDKSIFETEKNIKSGTYWYAAMTETEASNLNNSLYAVGVPYIDSKIFVVGIVVRSNDDYLGYLGELNNVPFGLMPLYVNEKHQTDLNVLTDCAEFAIYGKRRQGYKIGYVGPQRIIKFLTKMHKDILKPKNIDGHTIYYDSNSVPFSLEKYQIEPGDIIHFGDQVAVFFEDSGIKGILDGEDVMYYSYNQPPRIAAIQNTEFKNRPLKVYKWKLAY